MSNQEVLYHYTSIYGLEGIMNNSSFWATRSVFSNDIQDSKYIKNIMLQVLKLYDKNEYKDFIRALYDTFNYAENECTNALNCRNEIYDKAFVISFSHKKDSRFFWEAYTQNTGFNLMFNKEKLTNYFISYSPNIYYDKFVHKEVIYNEKEQKKILINIIEKALRYVNNNKSCDICNCKVIEGIIKELQFEAPFFKHPYWKEENEYRFAFFRKYNDMKLVNVKFNKKPKYEGINSNQTYIDMPFNVNLINKIIIGPCNYNNKNKLINKYKFIDNKKFKLSKGYGVIRKFIV